MTYHIVGFLILWICGLIAIPIFSMIIVGALNRWDRELGQITFFVAAFFYLLFTGILLILK